MLSRIKIALMGNVMPDKIDCTRGGNAPDNNAPHTVDSVQNPVGLAGQHAEQKPNRRQRKNDRQDAGKGRFVGHGQLRQAQPALLFFRALILGLLLPSAPIKYTFVSVKTFMRGQIMSK